MQGLNLKITVGALSREGTSSIEAHSSEKGISGGFSVTAEKKSGLPSSEVAWSVAEVAWSVAFSFVCVIVPFVGGPVFGFGFMKTCLRTSEKGK